VSVLIGCFVVAVRQYRQVDMAIAGITITKEREQDLDFSHSMVGFVVIVVKSVVLFF
jgi:ABC-type amino acid transport substrate-binding protein